MIKRKHLSKAEWKTLIDQQIQSGLNAAAFCDQHGLPRKSFYRHRKLLEQKSRDSLARQFTKVNSQPVQIISQQFEAVLRYRNSRIQLPIGTDPVWVAELLIVLLNYLPFNSSSLITFIAIVLTRFWVIHRGLSLPPISGR